MNMKVVMTGGHHSSALPVIRVLLKKQPNCEIFWLGHKHSLRGDKNETLEYKEISALNIPFYELNAGKFYKTLDWRRLIKIPFGFFHAFMLLKKIKPNIIMSYGGYLAVPVVLAGRLLGLKIITHEQTLVAGYATKLISIFADVILLSWEKSLAFLPNYKFVKKKVKVVGIPVRTAVKKVTSDVFELNADLPTIYITAGKSGSHIINEVVKKALPDLLAHVNVIHQCGDYSVFDDYTTLEQVYKHLGFVRGCYNLRKFVLEDEIGEAYAKADLVVARAGAHTCAELAYLNKPAVLIPIPWVSHNEQNINAKWLKDLGLTMILPEAILNHESLLKTIKDALKADLKLNQKLDKELFEQASEKIADEICK